MEVDAEVRKMYANPLIPSFLELFEKKGTPSSSVQVVRDGRKLTVEALKRGEFDISQPILVEDSPESIGMTVFKPAAVQEGIEDKVTVRHIADVIGHHFPVRVMDVEHQEELKGWTLGDLVDYFENSERLECTEKEESRPTLPCESHNKKSDRIHGSGNKKRKAALKATSWLASEMSRPRVLNQISLEYSRTALGPKVVPPKFVRDLDWISTYWPSEQKGLASYPSVLHYCLTSAEGCYTDFHADFGGSSVYYHVINGSKMFALIRPTKQNLKVYEEWLGCKDQDTIFLADLISNPNDVITLKLQESQTLFIPSGWVHAVYTPTDAIVLGGNFLHSFDTNIQLDIAEIESRTFVPQRFRFPYFEMVHFYVAGMVLKKTRDNCPDITDKERQCLLQLLPALEKWYRESIQSKDQKRSKQAMQAALYASKLNNCNTVDAFFLEMRMAFHNRSTLGPPRLSIVATKPQQTPSSGLESPKSPRIRINIKPKSKNSSPVAAVSSLGGRGAENDKDAEEDKADETLRIVISSVAKKLHQPLPSAKRNPRSERLREDLDYVDSRQDDEDWVPAASKRLKVGRLKSGNMGKSEPRSGNNPKPLPTQLHKECVKATPAKKTKTTSRQRLLKKFR
jgi:Jumonji helical domain